MKKLLVLILVLAMASAGWAATVTMRVESGDQKDSYEYSDTITIEVVADFGVGNFSISKVKTDNGGTSSSPALHEDFTISPLNDGDVVNSAGVLIQSVAGSTNGFDLSSGTVLWEFEFHVPDLEHSTYITISSEGVDVSDSYYMTSASSIGDLEIHVTPEPMTIALLGLGGLFLRRRK